MMPPPIPPASWTERYEALRRWAREEPRILTARPLGVILLTERGMAGWMRGWAEASPSARLPHSGTTASLPGPVASWQNQLTVVLAQMTAAHLQPTGCP